MPLALSTEDELRYEHLVRQPENRIPKAPRRVLSPVSTLQNTMNRKKILVVDDSLLILKLMSMKLTANGYEVVTAEDGGTAVSAARRDKPDLILLDLSFPPDVAHGGGVAWDGFLIMNWLQRFNETRNIPIVVITGGDPAICKDRALADGAVSFFHKPINNDEVLTVIRQILGERTMEAQQSVAPIPQPAG